MFIPSIGDGILVLMEGKQKTGQVCLLSQPAHLCNSSFVDFVLIRNFQYCKVTTVNAAIRKRITVESTTDTVARAIHLLVSFIP